MLSTTHRLDSTQQTSRPEALHAAPGQRFSSRLSRRSGLTRVAGTYQHGLEPRTTQLSRSALRRAGGRDGEAELKESRRAAAARALSTARCRSSTARAGSTLPRCRARAARPPHLRPARRPVPPVDLTPTSTTACVAAAARGGKFVFLAQRDRHWQGSVLRSAPRERLFRRRARCCGGDLAPVPGAGCPSGCPGRPSPRRATTRVRDAARPSLRAHDTPGPGRRAPACAPRRRRRPGAAGAAADATGGGIGGASDAARRRAAKQRPARACPPQKLM